MSHCHDGSCGHAHDDDDHVKPGEGQQDLLYSCINRDGVIALNEETPGSGVKVLKPYDQRASEDEYLESSADDQLILYIPFTGSVKLRSMMLKTGPADQTPSEIHLYVNRDDLDFDAANELSALPDTATAAAGGQGRPAQKLTSIPVTRDPVEIPLKPAKFPDVRSISLFVPSSVGGDTSRIYFVGFKGEHRQMRREGPTNIIYEAAPSLKDHQKVKGTEAGASSFGQGQ
ncbi:uncharacterized protein PFL1_01199 [Pseudozyma flocculosa PF-1]|uniref:Related to thioredoxin-like protein n=1 Tax=Pseudozyma flocculosa TaxID=84751 RepID=A0A5C3EU58_9BASI|nr:uncharacterized protein PFL1_01199 [Pseudozyma flocculosa PF-1]EPQ31010.1 hypothetical protein PFL1_01199 [Pseudozyma flocculosa PF-1]SPO35848.1 related to thioredoxin-like protein [Pseudozyma flocculosa]